MKKKYDVSVIICTYNPQWKKLKSTLLSALEQKNIDFEISPYFMPAKVKTSSFKMSLEKTDTDENIKDKTKRICDFLSLCIFILL